MGAVVLVAAALAPVLVVTSAPVAQAAAPVGAVLTVGARAAAPAAGALCVASGPVGWGVCGAISVGLLATGAYLTRDTWMPWLGLGQGAATPQVGQQKTTAVTWTTTPFYRPESSGWVFGYRWQATATTNNYYIDFTYTCQVGTVVYSGAFVAGSSSNIFSNGTRDGSHVVCGPDSTLLQLIGTPRPTSSLANGLTWAGPAGATNAGPNASPEAQAAADAAADLMNFRTETTCRLSDGSTQLVVVEAVKAPVMPSCQTRYPGSEVVQSQMWGGMDPSNIKLTAPQTITYDVATRYPDCAGGVCTLAVHYRGTACQEGATACVDWTRRALLDPGDYTCRYGPYSLPISQCDALERYYEVNGRALPATDPNVDGDPNTSTPVGLNPGTGTPVRPVVVPAPGTTPTPSPSPTGTATPAPTYTLPPLWLPDPDVNPGAPRPNPTSDPNAPPDPLTDPYQYPDPQGQPYGQPGTVIGPDGQPVPGSGGAPGGAAAPGAGGDPLLNQGNARCWPNGWGWFNPAEWVLRPLTCAFVPSPSTITRAQGIGTTLRTKAPVAQISSAAGFMAGFESVGSECWVQSVTLPRFGPVTLVDTCTPGPVEGYVMGMRSWLAVVVWVSFLAPLTWWAWREYAPGSKGVA